MIARGLKRWRVGSCMLLALSGGGSLLAQERPMASSHVLYVVQSGDSLTNLVSRYLSGTDALAQLLRINPMADPNRLHVGQTLKFPTQLLQTRPSNAVVSGLGCQHAVRRRGVESRQLQMGDGVKEGDVLSAPMGCQLVLSLEEASSVQLQSGTTVHIKTLRANKLQASPQVDLELQDGRVEVQVPRKRPVGDAPFEIRTSTSLAGIRGTEFRVGFDTSSKSSQLEVLTGRVGAMGRDDASETPVGALQGLSILANGRAQAVESLPGPARYLESQVGPDDHSQTLRFQRDPHAARHRVVWSQEVNATRLSPQTDWPSADIATTLPDGEAAFLHVRGVTASGLEGAGLSLGVCRGYLLQRTTRCDVRFDLSGATRSELRLTRHQDLPQVLFNAALPTGANDQVVLRGLWNGVYNWTLTQVMPSGERVQREGQFQLVVLPVPRG